MANYSYPFWGWGGEINKKEIDKQIKYFKDMGYSGFFIHSRTGLETEYMSSKWLNLVEYCVKKSAKLGLKACLYDEDRYPSGACGGAVTVNPKFMQKKLCMAITDKYVGENFSNVVRVFNVEFDGDNLSSYRKYDCGKGKICVFYIENAQKDVQYNRQSYVDTLNYKATEEFIKLTHDKYKKKLHKYFGNEIPSIFSDEVRYGMMFCEWNSNGVNQNKQVPYTVGLFEEFEKEYGYSLADRLPELFFKRNGEDFKKISWQYVNLLQNLFLQNFAVPYYKWCNENNLKFTGHILQEETLSSQTVCCGSVMRFYEYMDYPGIDILTRNGKHEWIIKQVVSVQKQLGKEHSIAECYGAMGYNVTIEDYKKVCDIMTCFGITLRVPHLAWYTMKGRCKRDYPSNLFYQNSGYEYSEYFEKYASLLNEYVSQGEYVTDVCVVSPVESVWAAAYCDAFNNDDFGAKAESVKEIEKDYSDVFYGLVENKIDFDYVDEGSLKERYSIIKTDNGVKFVVGKMSYSTVVVYGNRVMRKSTYDLLKEFADQGGCVVCNFEKLKYVDFNDATQYGFDGFVSVNTVNGLTDFVKDKQELKINAHKNLVFSVKKANDGYYAFVVNIDKDEDLGECEISFNGNYNVYEIDLFSNEIKALKFENGSSGTRLKSLFVGGQSRLYKLTKENIEIKPQEDKQYTAVELPNEFNYKLYADNVLVMDHAEYFVNGEYKGNDYVLSIDGDLRNTFFLEQKKEMMCQPYYKEISEPNYNDVLCDLSLKFTFNCEDIPDKLYLALEQRDLFKIKVNDNMIEGKSSGFWVDECFSKAEIPISLIRKGENTVELLCKYKDCVNIESVYLLGNFAVKNDCKTICKLPDKLKVGNIVEQGFPFYSDKIRYILNVESGDYKVCFNRLNGYTQGVIGDEKEQACFYPYQVENVRSNGSLEIEICPSRNNTFGPIHNKNTDLVWNGPFTFVDFKDGNIRKEFFLHPQGLTEKPSLFVNKK